MIPSMTLALCQGPCSRSVIASWDCWAAVEWAKSSMESRSEEHTSELQSRLHLVCRLLLEKKKFLHLEVKPLMTLTTVRYWSCALISGHLAMMLMELTKRRYAIFRVVFNRPINILCRVSLFLSMALCLLLRLFFFPLLRLKIFFFIDPATTEIYTLSLHDALPI